MSTLFLSWASFWIKAWTYHQIVQRLWTMWPMWPKGDPHLYCELWFDYTDKGLYSQSFGFSSSHVWMWELNHKKDWCQRTDAFQLWCWRRLLRVLWTARRSNQSIPKEINSEYSLEGLMMKLKLQYFDHLKVTITFRMRKPQSLLL